LKIFRCREQILKLPRFTGTKIRLKIREFRRCIMMKKTGSDNRDTGKSTRSRNDARNKQETQEKEEN